MGIALEALLKQFGMLGTAKKMKTPFCSTYLAVDTFHLCQMEMLLLVYLILDLVLEEIRILSYGHMKNHIMIMIDAGLLQMALVLTSRMMILTIKTCSLTREVDGLQ